ncbi:MAG: cytochrome c1 [Methylococcales bacterium]|nr:cytochrome c1 [Methylococcales bacterium]
MKTLILWLSLLLPSLAGASASGVDLKHARIDLTDQQSLQRGAKNFVTYCLGCHSAKYIRYLKISLDFELPEETVLKDIAPVGAGIYDPLLTAMNGHDSAKWFGITPPDLSLIARVRGADWLFTYLTGFYDDPSKPLGTNNVVFPDVGMPNVLWQLQGEQEAVFKTVQGQKVLDHLVLHQPGQLAPHEFDGWVNDLVNFLVYAAEPVQLERKSMGKYVLFFILMFTLLAYLLKKEYWRDVH